MSRATTKGPSLFRIVFWNLKKKDLNPMVCSLARSTSADALVLCEAQATIETTLQALQSEVSEDFYIPSHFATTTRFQCFCRNPEFDLSEIHEGSRISIRWL